MTSWPPNSIYREITLFFFQTGLFITLRSASYSFVFNMTVSVDDVSRWEENSNTQSTKSSKPILLSCLKNCLKIQIGFPMMERCIFIFRYKNVKKKMNLKNLTSIGKLIKLRDEKIKWNKIYLTRDCPVQVIQLRIWPIHLILKSIF